MPVRSQESERSCMCVSGVSFLALFTILIFDFGILPTERYCLCVFSSYCYVSVKVDENSLTNNYFNNTIYNIRCLISSLVYKTSLPHQCLECMYQARDVRGHLCVRGNNLASYYEFSIGLWNCSDSAIFFLFHFCFTNVLYL